MQQEKPSDKPPSSHELLLLIQAHNRKEITTEQWLKLSREWAERMLRRRQNGGS